MLSKTCDVLVWCVTLLLIPSIVAIASDDGMSYRVTTVSRAPAIDGLLDLCWRTGDSITTFVQVTPDEGQPLSESTTVYILQDRRALYVAFKCNTPGRYPDCRREKRESRSGDEVSLFLDTFFDRQTAYRFTVTCGNVQSDAVLSANGREENVVWDGVFESAVYVDTGIFIVEMAILWSSLQFDRDAPVWGFNLQRSIPRRGEVGYAVPVRQNEALAVSGFARLEGIAPIDRNLGLELAPTTFIREEKSYGEPTERLRVGADVNWALTSAVRLQTTFHPDFAQVEADPFALNLSKYAIYFSEKRPFFIEGQEYFDPPGGESAGLLTLFYSRSIGKRLPDGTEVPVQTGGRLVGKLPRLEFGTLIARTGSEDYEGWYGPETQQAATFAVNRVSLHPTPGTTVGLFQAGEYEQNHQNDVYSVDAGFSNSEMDIYGQVARSRYDDRNDWAWVGSFYYTPRGLSIRADVVGIGYDFDVSDIGFVPWYDYRSYAASIGPTMYPASGMFTYGKIAFGMQFDREYGEPIYASRYSVTLSLALRCNWGAGMTYAWGRDFEQDSRYDPRSVSGFLRSDISRRAWFMVNASTYRSFNYLRYYLARSWNIDWYVSFKPTSAVSIFFNGDAWIENDPAGAVEEVTWRFRPGCAYSVTRDVSVRAYGESTVYRSMGIRSVRLGLSLAYNFLPKSWLYVAYNDYQRRRADHTYQPLEQVFVMKVRYLVSM